MNKVIRGILMDYDTHIAQMLSGHYTSDQRAGLGRHRKPKGSGATWCHGRCARKRGYRQAPRQLKTVFGTVSVPLRVLECRHCGTQYSPLLSALQIGPYQRKEDNFERAVLEAVMDTNYRRVQSGHGLDISLGGIHNLIVENNSTDYYNQPVKRELLSAVMADGTGVKQFRGEKGELRVVIGIDQSSRVVPLGCFTNTDWDTIEKTVKNRLTGRNPHLQFLYDGEPGLDMFLADTAEASRCSWHAPRGLYHALWEDGIKKKESQPETDKLKKLVAIELPEADFDLLKTEDKAAVQKQYENSKNALNELISIFRDRGYRHGHAYLEGLAQGLFKNVELWLETGIIAPKTTSRLERVFRELGRRLKRIAWGWADETVTNLSKMILIKQYTPKQWKEFWRKKLGLNGYFSITLNSIEIANA